MSVDLENDLAHLEALAAESGQSPLRLHAATICARFRAGLYRAAILPPAIADETHRRRVRALADEVKQCAELRSPQPKGESA